MDELGFVSEEVFVMVDVLVGVFLIGLLFEVVDVELADE